MAELPCVHHVVFCVQRAHQDEAAALWTDLGFELAAFDLDDVGLRVLLDWNRGVEIISPSDDAGPEAEPYRRFLADHGEGVYSVVVRTDDIATPIQVAAHHGLTVAYEQQRGDNNFELTEAMLTPLHGMPVTLLATDLD
jgi:methylmalonyl-CoA/ethylmalonyl-CoA epimerase